VTCGHTGTGECPRPPLGTGPLPHPADCGGHAQRGLCGYGPGAPGGGLPLSVPASLRVGARLARLPQHYLKPGSAVPSERRLPPGSDRSLGPRGFASRSTGSAGCVQARASTLEIRAKRGVFRGPDDRQAPIFRNLKESELEGGIRRRIRRQPGGESTALMNGYIAVESSSWCVWRAIGRLAPRPSTMGTLSGCCEGGDPAGLGALLGAARVGRQVLQVAGDRPRKQPPASGDARPQFRRNSTQRLGFPNFRRVAGVRSPVVKNLKKWTNLVGARGPRVLASPA
jgi:hypothetical protein